MFRLRKRICFFLVMAASILWIPPHSISIASDMPVPTHMPAIYQEAETIYQASSLPQRKGPVVSSVVFSLPTGRGNRVILRPGDEIIAIGDIPIATADDFKAGMNSYLEGVGLPARLKVITMNEKHERSGRIEEVRTPREVERLMWTSFFSDQDLVDLALLRLLFADQTNKVLQKQFALKERAPSEIDKRSQINLYQQFELDALSAKSDYDKIVIENGGESEASEHMTTAFPALVVEKSFDVRYKENGELKIFTPVPGDVVSFRPVSSVEGGPDRQSPTRNIGVFLARVRDGTLSGVAVSELPCCGKNWAKPVRLDSRQLLIRSYARRAKGLKAAADEDEAFLTEAYPNSEEAIALDSVRAREQLATGHYSQALATATTVITKDPTGEEGQEAKQFVEEVKKDAHSRLELAGKYLDGGDFVKARRELDIVAQVIPADPMAKQATNRCESMELLAKGEKSMAEAKWSEAGGALRVVVKQSQDGEERRKAQAGLDRINAEGMKRLGDARRLYAERKFFEAKKKITEARSIAPDNSEIAQYRDDLDKDINQRFIKSGLKGQWEVAQQKLAELEQKNKPFWITGKITDQDIKRTWIIVLGRAIRAEDPDYKAVGTLLEDGAIQVNSPDERLIRANHYMGGVHYLTGKTTVKNALGAEIPAWTYGPVPSELVKARAEVENLRGKVQALGIELAADWLEKEQVK